MNLAFGTTTADASTRPLGTRLAELSRNGAGLMSEIILRGARRPERESAAPNLVVKSHFGQPSRASCHRQRAHSRAQRILFPGPRVRGCRVGAFDEA
jgi:hypothetical protein